MEHLQQGGTVMITPPQDSHVPMNKALKNLVYSILPLVGLTALPSAWIRTESRSWGE